MFPKPTCPKCGKPQPTNGPYLMPCHCEPRTVVFDGTAEMAERVGLERVQVSRSAWVWAIPSDEDDDWLGPVSTGQTLILDASGRAVGAKGEA